MGRIEFSKLILLGVMLTYFVGIGIGAWVVLKVVPEQLSVYLAFIGGPTAVAIGFYAWKAKAENVLKIGRTPEEQERLASMPMNQDQNTSHGGRYDPWR